MPVRRHESCVICGQRVNHVFTARVLQKYDVGYFRCSSCGFLQTEQPYWLEEAYASSLTSLDVWSVCRSLSQARLTQNIVLNHLDPHASFLDYGGGAGLFTRHMRDFGLDFYRYDRFAPNLFAQCFDIADLPEAERRFEMVTSFEVIEHLEDPMQTLREMLELSDIIFFSTGLIPNVPGSSLQNWDYLGCLHGQHISFFDAQSLKRAADLLHCNLITDGVCMHVIARRDLTGFSWKRSIPRKLRDRAVRTLAQLGLTKGPPRAVGSLTLRDAKHAHDYVLAKGPGPSGQ
jgi:Methyltransferase domain